MQPKTITLDFEMLDACPICESTDIHTAYKESYRGMCDIYMSFCGNCHLIFLNPRMTDAQTTKYYNGLYRDTVQENIEGVSQVDLDTQSKRAQLQVEIIKNYIDGCSSNIEIGCSAGYLLDELHKVGVSDCVGIEPDVRYHELEPAKHYKLYKDIREVEPRIFDLITMSHSLEHFNHPLRYIQGLIANYAHPGTMFMIEVPNTEYYQCFGIAHPMNFTRETLNGLFDKAGCNTIRNFTHGLDGRLVYKFLIGLYQVK